MLGCELVGWVTYTSFSSAGLPSFPWGAPAHIPGWGFVTDVPQTMPWQSTASDRDSGSQVPFSSHLPCSQSGSSPFCNFCPKSFAKPLRLLSPSCATIRAPVTASCTLMLTWHLPLGCAALGCSHTVSPKWAVREEILSLTNTALERPPET